MSGRAAVFLDRDGVINENLDGGYVTRWELFRFLPGVLPALATLRRHGYPVVVITNQAAIGRGLVPAVVVEEIHRRMCAAIQEAGGYVEAVLYCPHHPDEHCACRKPQPGLLLRAAAELRLDLARSIFIGDHVTDVQAGLAAGCRPMLVRTGRGRESQAALAADPALAAGLVIVDDLAAAAAWIIAHYPVSPAPLRLSGRRASSASRRPSPT